MIKNFVRNNAKITKRQKNKKKLTNKLNFRISFRQNQSRQLGSDPIESQAPLKSQLSPPLLQQQHLGGNLTTSNNGAPQKMLQQTRLIHVQGNSPYGGTPSTSQRRYSPYNSGVGQMIQQKRIINQNSNISGNSSIDLNHLKDLN